jgi:cytochrome b561
MSDAGTANAAATYSRGAIWLHWTIAALILFNLPVGWVHDMFGPATKPVMMTLHKSFGVTIFFLTLVRVGWRLRHAPPPVDPALRPWEASLSRATHAAFYAILLLMPLSGWLVTSASGVPVINYFWTVTIPPLPVHGHEAHELWESVHTLFGIAMSFLVLLHIAGALRHQFGGQRVLARMVPALDRRTARYRADRGGAENQSGAGE